MENVVIVAAGRTAIGTFGGSLSSVPAPELAATVIKALLEKHSINPAEVDELLLGNVLSAGLGQNPARQAMIRAGIPKETPAFTINKVCASGLYQGRHPRRRAIHDRQQGMRQRQQGRAPGRPVHPLR